MQIIFDTPKTQDVIKAGITLTQSAAQRILAVIAKKPNADTLKLRLKIHGGGCNGYSYSFELTDTICDNDHTFTNNDTPGATLVVDDSSLTFVDGSKVDYINTLETAQFVVENPKATTSCGCGNSFGL